MLPRHLLLLSILSLSPACGGGSDDPPATPPPGETATGSETSGADATDTPPPPPTCEDESDESFVILFGYKGVIPGVNIDEFDLNFMLPQQKFKPVNITNFSLKEEGTTCAYGCLVDDSLKYIAVNQQPPDQDGFDFKMGLFNNCLEAKILKGLTLENKAHFAFATHYIYFSEKGNCSNASCQYKISRLDLQDPTKTDVLIPFFPPADDPDWIGGHAIYKGRFTVSPDGESIVLLSPTIRSQKIYLWSKGTLHDVDYLCENFQNDQCIGTGSQYSDSDPVAISPDSSNVVMFTVNDRSLQLHRYSTLNKDDKGRLTILSVPPNEGDYRSLACDVRKDDPWKPVEVAGKPVFTPDGKRLLFIGKSLCPAGSKGKAETDILSMDPARIDKLTPLVESDLVNITKNAKGDIPDNTELSALVLAPDGKRIIFTATPMLDSQFKPIKETDLRQMDGGEIYMTSICGGQKIQLTSSVAYKALGPQALAVPDLKACPNSPLVPKK